MDMIIMCLKFGLVGIVAVCLFSAVCVTALVLIETARRAFHDLRRRWHE